MLAIRPRPEQHSTTAGGPSYLFEVEVQLRCAGRLLELDPADEAQRCAQLLFELASRVRTDRLGPLM